MASAQIPGMQVLVVDNGRVVASGAYGVKDVATKAPVDQAAQLDDVELIAFLPSRGARTDQRDTLWDGTPLNWAEHFGKTAARAALEGS